MKQESKLYKSVRLGMIIAIISAIILLLILFILVRTVSTNTSPEGQNPIKQPIAHTIDPAIQSFVDSYFMAIAAAEYDVLVKSYWTNSVVEEIRAICGNPIDQDPAQLTKELWLTCGVITPETVEIISVTEESESVQVIVQFFDENGEIIGLDLRPEWVRGHTVRLEQSALPTSGFKTSDWRFLN